MEKRFMRRVSRRLPVTTGLLIAALGSGPLAMAQQELKTPLSLSFPAT